MVDGEGYKTTYQYLDNTEPSQVSVGRWVTIWARLSRIITRESITSDVAFLLGFNN